MMRWPRTTVFALVILAVVFGHEALMAADTHRAEVDHLLAMAEANVTPDTDMGDAPHVSPAAGSLLQSVCPSPDITPAAPHPFPLDGPPFVGVLPVVAPARVDPWGVPVGNHIPPGYPPAVRRALLQVFLN